MRIRDAVRTGLFGATLAGFVAALGCGGTAAAQNAKAPAGKAAVPAPVSSDPASTSATYGDWVLRCQRVGEADKAQRVCEVSQTIQAQNAREPVAEVALGRLPTEPALRITAVLPPSVTLPSMVEVSAPPPSTAAVTLQWKRCLPGGCFADAVPGEEVVKAWRGATGTGKLAFKDAAGRDVVLPVSFRGLAQALDALGR